MKPPTDTTVLVVGGGPVGLTTSILLSLQGIANVVVERRAQTQKAPAAHVLRRRPLELLARIGVTDEIEKRIPPLDLDYIVFCTDLAGPEVGRLDVRASSDANQRDAVWANCSQNILEPILLERAQREAAATICRGVDCIAVSQDERGVTTTVRDSQGADHTIRSSWLIAADGAGSPTRRMLGIPMIGAGPQGRFFMVHFEADLREQIEGRSGPLYWIMNPQAPGTLIVHDPAKSIVFMTLRRGSENEEQEVPARLAAALGAPIEHRILSIDEWSPHVQIAETYRKRRAFLVGDAAHRFPPTGGLGLNTGLLDAEVLTFLLGKVEVGKADPSRLDEYELACKPAAQSNADDSFANMKRLAAINEAIGPVADLDALKRRVTTLTPAERRALDEAIELQRSHFLSEGRLPDWPSDMPGN